MRGCFCVDNAGPADTRCIFGGAGPQTAATDRAQRLAAAATRDAARPIHVHRARNLRGFRLSNACECDDDFLLVDSHHL